MMFTRFSGHCLLWPWLSTPKAIQHIYEPICLWRRLGEIPLIGFWHTVFTRFSGHSLPAVTLTFWPQNLINTSMNSSTSVAKIGWNYLHWLLRQCSQGFRDAQTQSTHGHTDLKRVRLWHRFLMVERHINWCNWH